jgi:hypothetical protein
LAILQIENEIITRNKMMNKKQEEAELGLAKKNKHTQNTV